MPQKLMPQKLMTECRSLSKGRPRAAGTAPANEADALTNWHITQEPGRVKLSLAVCLIVVIFCGTFRTKRAKPASSVDFR